MIFSVDIWNVNTSKVCQDESGPSTTNWVAVLEEGQSCLTGSQERSSDKICANKTKKMPVEVLQIRLGLRTSALTDNDFGKLWLSFDGGTGASQCTGDERLE